MKNIALVTWLGTGNYGTSLQSFALHQFLLNKGYRVFFLHEFSRKSDGAKVRLKKAIRDLRYRCRTFIDAKEAKMRLFNRDNYNHCWIKSKGDYSRLIASTDVFLTGSDQIWNCFHFFDPFMFLDFSPSGTKKVAYASSMGTAHFPEEHLKEVKRLLGQFQHIGVREISIVAYLNSILSRDDIKCVLDPTFLLDSKMWQEFGAKANLELSLPETYILCYFVGNRDVYSQQLESIKNATGISKVILVPSLENKDICFPNTSIYKKAGPYEFVKLLNRATIVCTDSFHACALSINLSKDFVVFKRFDDIDKRSQNNRIYDLMVMFGLENNIYSKDWEYGHSDYSKVQEILNKKREESIGYLINAIEK